MLLTRALFAFQIIASPAPSAWPDRLSAITAILETRHPDFAARIGRREYAIEADRLRRELPVLDDAHALVRLMQLVAGLRDGHTQLQPTDSAFARWYPVRFYAFPSGVYITAIDRAHRELVGRRVLRVGRLSAEEALARAESVMGADNEWGARENLFALSSATLLYGLDVTDSADSLRLEVAAPAGPVHATLGPSQTSDASFDGRFRGEMFPPFRGGTVDWVTAFGGRAPLDYRKHDPALPLHLRYRFYFFMEPLPKANALYAQVNFMQEDDTLRFADFTDSLFARLDRHPVARLILDLRYNSGGNGALVPRFERALIVRAAAHPWGQIYVLTGRKTFSAGIQLAGGVLEAVPDAMVVGEPSGAGLNHFGDPMAFEIPGGLRLSVSTIWHQGAKSDDVRPWIPVNLPVAMDAADYFAGRDPALDLVTSAEDTRAVEAIAEGGDTAAAARALAGRLRRCAGLAWCQPFSEERMNELGYRVLRGGNAARAVAIFALNTTAYPGSWNAWDSEGEALARAGRTADAVAAYRRSLTLNPGNEGARTFLRDHAVPAPTSSGR